jgi:hypothetical protein
MPIEDLRATRANHVFGTDKNHPYQKHGYGKKQRRFGFAFINDRRLRTDAVYDRTQSAIRADGTPSAQVRASRLDSRRHAQTRIAA